ARRRRSDAFPCCAMMVRTRANAREVSLVGFRLPDQASDLTVDGQASFGERAGGSSRATGAYMSRPSLHEQAYNRLGSARTDVGTLTRRPGCPQPNFRSVELGWVGRVGMPAERGRDLARVRPEQP